jgi:hypothetical protein
MAFVCFRSTGIRAVFCHIAKKNTPLAKHFSSPRWTLITTYAAGIECFASVPHIRDHT